MSLLRVQTASPTRLRRTGFTLLELILALAIAATLAVALYRSMRAVFQARASAEAAVEPARTADLAMSYLRTDLQNAVPTPPSTGKVTRLAGPFEGISGSGGPDDVIFYSTADSPDHATGNGDIRQIELAVQTPAGESEPVLLRRVWRNLLSTVQATPDEEVLCRGVAAFRLRYFTGTDWITTWDSTQENDTIPAAVEVTLELDRPGSFGEMRRLRYVRIIPLPCSTLSSANPATGMGGLTP